MSGDKENATAGRQSDKPRSLAKLNLNDILSKQQLGTSSEDEASEAQQIPAEDATGAVGVSIGWAQTRLTSPKTPAVEKAAAIEEAGGFFGDAGTASVIRHEQQGAGGSVLPGAEQEFGLAYQPLHQQYDGSHTPPSATRRESSSQQSEAKLPSPWRVNRIETLQAERSKSRLRDGLPFNRRRASSGPESTLSSWHRSVMSNLPSFPRHWLPFSSTTPSLNGDDARQSRVSKRSSLEVLTTGNKPKADGPTQSPHRSAQGHSGSRELDGQYSPPDMDEAYATVGELPDRPQLRNVRSRRSQLKRSNSDTSMITQRTLSRVSSLGDDTRFEHVQEQVNSRMKAIRDSWQDANFKLPGVPSFTSLTPDFLRDRSSSINRTRGFSQERDSRSRPEKPQDPITMQPYATAKQALSDATTTKAASTHPNFSQALEQLDGDVVILGGYRGSILRSADPPHRQLWVPIKVGLNLRKVDLEVGLQEGDDERATEKIIPGGMLSHIGPVDISRRLFKRLRASENAKEGRLRVHDYGYDWRLDPNHLSRQLLKFLESLPCNRAGVVGEKRGAIVIAHSLGGLITRHVINQRPDLVAGVLYAGVPQTCVNILGPLRNGDEVLLSSRVLTAQVNFTVRTSFVLLPLDGRCFFDKHTKEEYPVDFFDPQTWVACRLSPCVARPLPSLSASPKPAGITGYVSSVTSALPSLSLPGRKGSLIRSGNVADSAGAPAVAGATDIDKTGDATESGGTVANGNNDTLGQSTRSSADAASSIRTAVTIPNEEAIAYLTRTLASVKKFKQELAFNPAHGVSNAYPPISVIYGKSTPTVYGAKVNGRESIKHADAYDELAFASGDGVVLARAAMVPERYVTARGGVVSSERGHVTLLGDLEAVGRCLNAILEGRKRGVGLGRAQ